MEGGGLLQTHSCRRFLIADSSFLDPEICWLSSVSYVFFDAHSGSCEVTIPCTAVAGNRTIGLSYSQLWRQCLKQMICNLVCFTKDAKGRMIFASERFCFAKVTMISSPNLIHIRNRMGKVAKIVQTVENWKFKQKLKRKFTNKAKMSISYSVSFTV